MIRTRANPILLGSAAMLALAAGWLPAARAQTSAAAACATCGIVEAVRAVETRGDARAGGEGQRPAGTRLSYRVTVRMSDGSYRTLAQATPPAVGVGDRVRVAEGAVVREN